MPKPEACSRKYLYCLTHSPQPYQFSNLGMGERGDVVDMIEFMDLGAVVSDTPLKEFEESRRNMMAHTLVLEEAMRQFSILPVRFGTVAPDANAILEQVLKRRYGELLSSFDEVHNRVELGIKAFWYEEIIFQEIVEQSPPIRALRDSLKGRQTDETYYERIRLGEMIEAAMEKKREEELRKNSGAPASFGVQDPGEQDHHRQNGAECRFPGRPRSGGRIRPGHQTIGRRNGKSADVQVRGSSAPLQFRQHRHPLGRAVCALIGSYL